MNKTSFQTRSRTQLLLILLLMSWAFSTKAALKPEKVAGQRWYQASTSNFTVISDRGKKETRRLTENLEKFRALYAVLLRADLSSIRPIKLIVTQRDSTYKLLFNYAKGAGNTGGFFTNQISGNYSALRSYQQAEDASLSVLFHEYAHYLQANVGGISYPYWYNEGYADFLGSTRFISGGGIHYGVPIDYHRQNLNRKAWMPMEKLLKSKGFASTDRRNFSKVYSQGWLAVHYFTSSSERNQRLSDYLRLLHEGKSVDEAVRDGFKVSFEELDSELKKYKNQKKLYYLNISKGVKLDVEKPRIEKMQKEQVAYELGEFLLNGRGNYELAKPYFEYTLEQNPKSADALAAIANTYLGKSSPEMKPYVEKAMELEPENPWVATVAGHYYSAMYNSDEQADNKTQNWNSAIKSYNTAIKNDPQNAEALHAAAQLYMERGRWEKALTLNEMVLNITPVNFSIRWNLVKNYYATGNKQKAEAMISKLQRTPHISNETLEKLDEYIDEVRAEFDS